MGKPIDLTGRRLARSTVMRIAENDKRGRRWWIKCDCGNEKTVSGADILHGHVSSCGCMHEEFIRSGVSLRTHGLTETPEYVSWRAMKHRCRSPNASDYESYGGRGVDICGQWMTSFDSFMEHIGPMPSAGMTVERIDNERGYEPGNVRWATRREQGANMRINVRITAFGMTLHLAEWERRTGLPHKTIRRRISRGMTAEEALSTPRRYREKIHDSDMMEILSRAATGEAGRSIAKSMNVSEEAIYRITGGMDRRSPLHPEHPAHADAISRGFKYGAKSRLRVR